ncbi:MAG TPA: hypothetical protein QGF02_00820 [Candidatus Babeliales bacterium]|nr:hypothetical protein [Candidatus Babeliales bacterium]
MKHWRLLLVCLPLLLANCGGRFVDWGKCQFNQGCDLPNNVNCVQDYIRSVRVYDEFTTLGIFNAIWLAPAVQNAALDTRALKYNLSNRDKKASSEAIIEDANKYVSFYMLAYQPRWLGSIFGKKDSHWNMVLEIDGKRYEPLEIKRKEIEDIDPIYLGYFRERLTRHKKIYFVRFAATEPGGKSLFTPETHEITLCVRSLSKQVALGWELCSGPEQILQPEVLCGFGCNESGVTHCGECQICPSEDPCDCEL